MSMSHEHFNFWFVESADFDQLLKLTLPSERKPTTNTVVFFVIERTQNVGHGATGRLPLFACSCWSHVPDDCFCALSDTYKAVPRQKKSTKEPTL
jgi:hypothetical protein